MYLIVLRGNIINRVWILEDLVLEDLDWIVGFVIDFVVLSFSFVIFKIGLIKLILLGFYEG